MKNIGLKRLEIVSPEKFTNPTKMKIRKIIHPLVKKIILSSVGKEVIVEKKPQLEKDEEYIFVSSHCYNEDIQVALGIIDRNAWLLLGSTDQIENNPTSYAGWANGFIYVDRNDKKSRSDSVEKMRYILENGSSVLIFAEGGLNNTENLLIQPLFASPHRLCCETGKKVVPLCTYRDEDNDKLYVRMGEPLDLSVYDKKEALTILRDEMASMMYEMILNHSKQQERSKMYGDLHLDYMEHRRKEYLKSKWTRDVWDEELTVYQSKDITTAKQVRESLDKVNVNADNAFIYAPILVEREEDEKYDFKKYMKRNWNK